MTTKKSDLTTLLPNNESTTSAVLNGVSNGLMVSAAPFFYLSMREKAGKPISKDAFTWSYLASAAGILGGGFYGLREARKLKQYRGALTSEVTALHDGLDALKKKLAERPPLTWEEKVSAVRMDEPREKTL